MRAATAIRKLTRLPKSGMSLSAHKSPPPFPVLNIDRPALPTNSHSRGNRNALAASDLLDRGNNRSNGLLDNVLVLERLWIELEPPYVPPKALKQYINTIGHEPTSVLKDLVADQEPCSPIETASRRPATEFHHLTTSPAADYRTRRPQTQRSQSQLFPPLGHNPQHSTMDSENLLIGHEICRSLTPRFDR